MRGDKVSSNFLAKSAYDQGCEQALSMIALGFPVPYGSTIFTRVHSHPNKQGPPSMICKSVTIRDYANGVCDCSS